MGDQQTRWGEQTKKRRYFFVVRTTRSSLDLDLDSLETLDLFEI